MQLPLSSGYMGMIDFRPLSFVKAISGRPVLDVDVSSFGDSEDDALANLREALELFSRTLQAMRWTG